MGRKPFPVRGTNFAQERGRFNRSKRKLQADACWWEPPPKMDTIDLEIRMGELDFRIQEAEQDFAKSARLMRSLSRMRPGRVYNFESEYAAANSVRKDKSQEGHNTAKVYYQDKAGRQIVALSFYGSAPPPDSVQVETVYGDKILVYRREYLELDDWERRTKCVFEERPSRKTIWRDNNYGYPTKPVDPWRTRLNLIMEASNV